MKRMDLFSLHCQNCVIHQCHYSGFISVLACIQAVLGLLQLAKADSLNSCKTYFLPQAEHSFKELYFYLYFCEYLSARQEAVQDVHLGKY